MKNQKGFTIVEVLTTVAILTLMTMVSFIYFKKNTDSQSVRSSISALGDALRTAQNYAQSGTLVNGQVPTAFGVSISTVAGVPTAVIYADISSPANYLYDGPGSANPDTVMKTIDLDLNSFQNTRTMTTIGTGASDGIVIDTLSPTGMVDIAFTTPNANMRINGATSNNQVVFSIRKGAIVKTLTVDRPSGRVQTSF